MGTKILGVVLVCAMAGCGGDEEPPSCQQAIGAYYGAGCYFTDVETGQTTTQQEANYACLQVAAQVAGTSRCSDAFDDWLICIEASTPADQCDCSREYMALIQC